MNVKVFFLQNDTKMSEKSGKFACVLQESALQ